MFLRSEFIPSVEKVNWSNATEINGATAYRLTQLYAVPFRKRSYGFSLNSTLVSLIMIMITRFRSISQIKVKAICIKIC